MNQLQSVEAIENAFGVPPTYCSPTLASPVLGRQPAIEANLPKRGGKTRALTKEDFSQQGAIHRRAPTVLG